MLIAFSWSQYDWTALHYCVVGGHLEACTLLLDRGAEVDAKAMVSVAQIERGYEEGLRRVTCQ